MYCNFIGCKTLFLATSIQVKDIKYKIKITDITALACSINNACGGHVFYSPLILVINVKLFLYKCGAFKVDNRNIKSVNAFLLTLFCKIGLKKQWRKLYVNTSNFIDLNYILETFTTAVDKSPMLSPTIEVHIL